MRRTKALLLLAIAIATLSVSGIGSQAQEHVRIGFSIPVTGSFAENGRQMQAAAKLFLEKYGTSVAGREIDLIIRDDGGVPDQAKRIAQELVVNTKVSVLIGYNPTPTALAVAPLATEAKIPTVITGAATSFIPERSPYIVRTFSNQILVTIPIARWAASNGIRRVVTLVSDYAPGLETEKAFADEFKANGGEIVEALRAPLQNPDYAPYLQRARNANPDALFVWVPGGIAAPLMRQYVERGLFQSGIKLIGTGDITDDDVLNQMGDPVLGVITSLQYSAAHPSPLNRDFVEGFARAGNGIRPDHIGVAAYDGLRLIYEALKKTGGSTNGDALIAAMTGTSWESPRGPVSIDPVTRDIVQDMYIRRVERVHGQLFNVEIDKFEAIKSTTAINPSK